MEPPTQAALVLAAQAGDQRAFEAVVARVLECAAAALHGKESKIGEVLLEIRRLNLFRGSIATLKKSFGFAPTLRHRTARYVVNPNIGPDTMKPVAFTAIILVSKTSQLVCPLG